MDYGSNYLDYSVAFKVGCDFQPGEVQTIVMIDTLWQSKYKCHNISLYLIDGSLICLFIKPCLHNFFEVIYNYKDVFCFCDLIYWAYGSKEIYTHYCK